MKKVLILNPYVPTLGGGEKYMGYMCQALEQYYENNIVIEILVFNYNDIDVTSDDYITVNDINKQYNLTLKNTSFRKIPPEEQQTFGDMNRMLNAISSEYDLAINFMIFSKYILAAKKNIYLCMFPPQRDKQLGRWKQRVITYIENEKFLKSYDKFIIISEFSKKWFIKYWGKNVKTKIIYSPVFSEENIEGRYIEKNKKNIILSVGRFFPSAHSKNQLEMVRFFINNENKLNGYEYHLAGAISNLKEDQEYLRKIKKISSKSNNVIIHENCKYEDLMELYAQAKVFWHATGFGVNEEQMPEKMEHFGITTVEAMSYGVVPIVIQKGGQSEIVIEGVNGFLWKNEEECIEKTRKIIKEDKMRTVMAQKAVERSKRFSTERFYLANKELYDELSI